jgi:hypothetical protein
VHLLDPVAVGVDEGGGGGGTVRTSMWLMMEMTALPGPTAGPSCLATLVRGWEAGALVA